MIDFCTKGGVQHIRGCLHQHFCPFPENCLGVSLKDMNFFGKVSITIMSKSQLHIWWWYGAVLLMLKVILG